MKKLALVLLAMTITACSTPPSDNTQVNWKQDNLAALADTAIELKSNLWIDQMPQVGNYTELQPLNGSLMLDTPGELSANLVVKMIAIKQGEKTWFIQGDESELRTQSENRWEVVFSSNLDVNVDKTVNIALELTDENGDEWLVQRNIKIEKVY